MRNSTLLKVGIIGTIVSIVCCFTPALVVLISVVGLSAITGYLDLVLLPALALFIGMTLWALWKKPKT